MTSQPLDTSIIAALADFEKSNSPSVWANLDKKQVLAEIKIRLNDPFQVNQGGQPFCGPASILFELIRKQPLRYVQICRSLFETGGFAGQTKRIQATERLRRSQGRLRMSQADWMVLATLRESENLIFPVEPDAPDILRNLAGMTKSWEMKGWTQEVLNYRQVKYIHTYIYGETEALNTATQAIASGGVAFALITADGLLDTGNQPFLPYPNHWITILGNISIKRGLLWSKDTGRFSMDVYSWAKKYYIDKGKGHFEDYFWGVVLGSM
ncbi:hypothetical protein NIES2100_02050 [Calothrix sp. NIES-2100]|uniref:hypothetical protein n=1 Tax=Calothrix sp. NIES-2100 TaxID=1954172 RepID=UPI000B608254|nr:hypothetical protein NIES2100_02050 [Calothrix sp. NIES-2100]